MDKEMDSNHRSAAGLSSMPSTALSSVSAAKTEKRNLIARQARVLFSAYRRDEFADPDGYLIQLGAVLEAYTEETIISVTDPRTGIQRTAKWPPSIAEVVEACEAETRRQNTIARYSALPAPLPRLPAPKLPGRRANLFVPQDNPRYAEMVALAEVCADNADFLLEHNGIRVRQDWWLRERGEKAFRGPTDDELRAYYGTIEQKAHRNES